MAKKCQRSGRSFKLELFLSFELTIFVINILVMSEKEMNSYRLTSLEEPTDENDKGIFAVITGI